MWPKKYDPIAEPIAYVIALIFFVVGLIGIDCGWFR